MVTMRAQGRKRSLKRYFESVETYKKHIFNTETMIKGKYITFTKYYGFITRS